MAASKKKQHTVELTPQHVAEAIEQALRPFENYDENFDKELLLDMSGDLFKITKASHLVSVAELRADIQKFKEDVQAALVPRYMREAKTTAMSPAIVHEILELEDQTEDSLFIQARVRIHGMYVARTGDMRLRHPYDYFRKVK